MQFVIQTGGKGTRVKKITNGNAKCLINIGKKKIIDFQYERLKKYTKKKIIILNNIKFKSLEIYLKKKYESKFFFFNEKNSLGTGGAIKSLKEVSCGTFVMIYGDIIFDIDFNRLINFHKKNKADVTLVSHPNKHPYDSDIISVNNLYRVEDFHIKPHKKNTIGNLCCSGIFVFNKNILREIKNKKKQDFTRTVVPNLIKKKYKIFSYNSREYMKDAGTVDRIQEVKNDIKLKKPQKLNFKKKIPAIFLDKDGVINKEKYDNNYQDIKCINSGVLEAIKIINNSNYLAVVVTNQPAIAKGFVKEEQVLKDFKYLESYLGKYQAYLDRIYYCPHHPKQGFVGEVKKFKIKCKCRKPENGMIIKASKELNLDFKRSIMLGDKIDDYMAAKKSKLKFSFIGNNTRVKGIKNFKNLLSAVKFYFN
jgi:mannose-1-phosphate guanylyltransferase/phosphomannomutase